MTVIELGDLSSGELEPAVPAGFDRRLPRRAAVALLAVLCLLTVAGSAPTAEPRGVRALWSMAFDQQEYSTVTATSIYTVFLESTRILTARNLSDGAVRWRRQLPAPLTGGVNLVEQAGVLLVPAARVGKGDGGTFYDEFTTDTVALDPGSGAELWHYPGAVALVGADTALFTRHNSSGRFLSNLGVVRLRDGSTVWSRPVAGADRLVTDWPVPSRPDRIVTVTPAGRVEVLRYTDGVRLAAGPVEWPVRASDAEGHNEVMIRGGKVFVSLIGLTDAAVIGYDADTLRRLWRVEDLSSGGTTLCGTAVCGLSALGTVALDGSTGKVRWSDDQIQSAWPVAPGRLLTDNVESRPQLLLDDETGRVIANLGPGFVVPDATGDTAYFLRLTRSPADRTSVSRIDLRTGRTSLRGTIDRIDGYGCTAVGDRLVCPTSADRIIVTAVG
jgi:putative pyrroloquinoline-quinone binding quinoprotein